MEDKELSAALEVADDELQKALGEILARCDTYEQAFGEFAKLYENAPLQSIEEVMFRAIANAQIIGNEEADDGY